MIGSQLKLNVSSWQEETLRQRLARDGGPGGLTLAENGRTDYQIVYPAQAGSRLQTAARFLQEALLKITGACFPLGTDAAAEQPCEILLGQTARRPAFAADDDAASGAYRIETQPQRLLIAGADEMGTAFGVYGFLEDMLGCMWLTPEENYFPSLPTVKLPPLSALYTPDMAWRQYYCYEAIQNGWFDRLRLNGYDYHEKGNIEGHAQWGNWCHTYYDFIHPKDYFKEHPEYFAMRHGRRVSEYKRKQLDTQLCLTNPDVKRIVKEQMRRKIEAEPEKRYWDFSVMDSWDIKGCHCPACRKLDRAAGSGMGSLLPLINELAREFPEKYISTLAYFHTIKPPKNGLKAEKNVVVKLCAMPGSQASSYLKGETKRSKQFQTFLQSWNQICGHIIIWDYVINFKHLLLPFPNFTVQKENEAFYAQNGVKGIFHQASRERNDEMAELRAYLLSRLMWDGPKTDVEGVISKYLAVYYGPAAPMIAAYLEACSAYFYHAQKELGLYDHPYRHWGGYLSRRAIRTYQALFTQAEQAAAGDETVLTRVQKAKLPVLYAKMTEGSLDIAGKREAAGEFFSLAKKFGIEQISEVKMPIETFQKKYKWQPAAGRATR